MGTLGCQTVTLLTAATPAAPLNVSSGTLNRSRLIFEKSVFSFTLEDYCPYSGSASVSAELISDVIVARMEAHIPSSSEDFFHAMVQPFLF